MSFRSHGDHYNSRDYSNGMRGRRTRPPRVNVRPSEIVKLNVGGRQFTTSRATLTWIPDTFFTGLLSNRIPSVLDETGAIFVDRDPDLFAVILNFCRTKNISLDNVDINSLLHEAEYFGIIPLVRRLSVCASLKTSNCGDLLFHALLPPPVLNEGESPVILRRRVRNIDPKQVVTVMGSHNYIAVAYSYSFACYKLGEFSEWRPIFTSPKLDYTVEILAFNSRVPAGSTLNKEVLIAVASGSEIHLWNVSEGSEVAHFDLEVKVDTLMFIASGLVALSQTGLIGVWNTMTQNWKIQQVQPVTSYDIAGCLLILGCSDGCIYCVDMAKFPLRMKDNDLLVSKLYCDPERNKGISITAISVYLTPKQCTSGQQCGEWLEIAYGTSKGMLRVIFQHPETVGQGPQLLQTFTVHRAPVIRVMLSENHLVSVCAESNHVRSWTVTRFRGRILTQPSSTPLASFNIISLDEPYSPMSSNENSIGPHGDKDDWAVFLQKVVQNSNELFVCLASTGKRLCSLRSVDGSDITAHSTHECDSSSRTRMRRYILTGHQNGSIQMWDLTTAFERAPRDLFIAPEDSGEKECGISQEELLRLMNHCDLQASLSTSSSPFSSNINLARTDDEEPLYPNAVHHDYDILYDPPQEPPPPNHRRSLSSDSTGPGPSNSGWRPSPGTTPVNSDDERPSPRKANTLPRRR